MNSFLQRISILSMQQVLIVALGLGGLYYFTMFDSGGSIDANIAALQTNIQAEEAKKKVTDDNLAKEKQMRDLVGLLGKQFQEVSQRLPAELSPIELKRQIDSFSKITRVSIKSFAPMDEKTVQIVREVPASISVEGSYSQLLQFIDLISKSERVMSVRNVSMEPQAANSAKLILTTQVIGYEMVIDEKPKTKEGVQK